MPSFVTIPEIGEIEFPDGISSAEIAAVSEKLYLEKVGAVPRLTDEQLKDPAAVRAYSDALNRRFSEAQQTAAARDAKPLSDQPQGFWNTVRQPLADPALSLAKGVVGVPEAAVGLADIPTGGRVGKALEETIGYDPKFTKEWLARFYSPEQKAANEEVAKARGFFNTVQAMGENPSTVVNTVAESIPTMLGGAAIGRTALAVVPRIGPVVAGAIGEGAVTAGQTAEQLRQESETGLLTPKQSVLSATSGAATGLIGVLGGGLARRLGVTDIDTLLAGGSQADAVAKKNILRRISESALSEGLLEELPQSAQELVQQNYASGRPWHEGVAEASAQGLLAGIVMGGAGGAFTPRRSLRGRESILRREVTPLEEAQRPQEVLEPVNLPSQTVQSVEAAPPTLAPVVAQTVQPVQAPVTQPDAPTPPTPVTQPTAPTEPLADAGRVADSGTVAVPAATPAEVREVGVDEIAAASKRELLQAERERILNDIDDWRSGKRGTAGRPATGERYQLEMRENVRALDQRLAEINKELSEGPTLPKTKTPQPKPESAAAKYKREIREAQENAPKPQFETIIPAEDTHLGKNRAGEDIYERKDGSRYRMRFDSPNTKPNGYPSFSGDLAPVETKTPEPSESGRVVEPSTIPAEAQPRSPEVAPAAPSTQAQFKKGDKVITEDYGKGVVHAVLPNRVLVKFDDGKPIGVNPKRVKLDATEIKTPETRQVGASELDPAFSDIHKAAREAAIKDNPSSFLPTEKTKMTQGPGMPGSAIRKQWDIAYKEQESKQFKAQSETARNAPSPMLSGQKEPKPNTPALSESKMQAEVAATAVEVQKEKEQPPFSKQTKSLETLEPKEQKKFLLEELAKAIEESPAQAPQVPADEESKAVGSVSHYAAGENAETFEARRAEVLAPLFEKYQIPTREEAFNAPLSLEGTPVVPNREARKLSTDDRVGLLKWAIRTERMSQLPKVTIDIPGDGTFSIVNSKAALKDFQERAKKFPVKATTRTEPSQARTTASQPPKVETNRTFVGDVKAIFPFTSTDESRYVLNYVYSDGKQLVATDGRRIMVVQSKGGVGTPKKPVLLKSDGSPQRNWGTDEKTKKPNEQPNFPNFNQVIPNEENTKPLYRNLDTARLFTLLKQVIAVKDMERSPTVYLHTDKDGRVGITGESPGIGEYATGITESSKPVMAVNSQYLLEAIEAARRLGSEKVDFNFIDELSPLVMTGKGWKYVVMPMRMEGGIGGQSAASMSIEASTKEPTSFRETAESIAEKLEGIKSGRQAGDLQLFGVIPAVWDAAISIAQSVIRAGGTAADAIAAAFAHIRANQTEPFDEPKVTEFIEGVVKPQTQFTEPDVNEAEPPAAQTVNIAGRTYEVISKDKLTPEQRKAADIKAQEKFEELGIPGAADTTEDTRAGSINNNTVFRVVSDGQNHDAQVQALRTHLIDEIQRQHSPGGDPAYVGSLINAINMNFDLGRWQDVVSQPVLESLLDVSVGESSKSGTMLRRFRGISEDLRAVAQNAALRLKWEYAKALDPENYAKGALTRIVDGIRKNFTEQEITNIALKIAKPEEAQPIVEAIRKAVAGDFASMSDIMKAAQAALIEAGMTEPQAHKIVSEAETILRNTVRDGANAAIAQMKEELTPEKKRGAAGRALTEIQKMMLNDLFGYSDLLTRLAKAERWVVPNAKDFEQMRAWAKREEALRTPTADEIAKFGSPETATEMVSAATLDARRELLRKMNSQWSQWTKPLITNWRDLADPIKVKNTNMAFNEWVAANLLLKIGFGTRQVWDVGSQMVLNTPTRAISYAFEAWQNDKAAGRDSNLQHNIAEALTDAYRARIKVLVPALNAFKETLVGRGEQKQVEQLISSIGIFDRALMNASRLRAEGKRGAANLLEVIAITTRMGRQFAAAMDVLQGIPAETQEIAHTVRNALREKGLTGAELQVQYDSIIGLLSAYRAEAISLARETLELKGVEATRGAVERAAWHILREKIYHASQQAGLKTDDWHKNNERHRDLLGWNLPETKGIQGVGGPGGWVALGGKAAKEMLSNVPVIGGVLSTPFTFANAMGISLNRKLAWSPLGFFPGIFKGSPHWEGETNIRQRKIEATFGTGISATVFSLILAGVWKALPAFWPKDDKEKERWVQNGWQPGMVLIPWGNGQELHISTRVGPLAFFSPAIAAAAAYTAKVEEREKKQAVLDARAKKLGVKPEKLPDLSAADWMGVMLAAGYSSLTGGRTASGALAAYSDYGTFNVKKAAASVAGAVLPGFPALNEFGRMAGGNINPKLATFWDLLVPMPTSDAQRVNMLGDPMRDENDYRRVFQILSGGNFPFPTSATPAETQAYAALFESDYRPPAINPGRGYNIGGRYRPFTSEELGRYTTLRGQNFKRELGSLGASPSDAAIKEAFVRANDAALASVGVAVPVRQTRTAGRTRSGSRFRLGRTRRGRSLRLGRRRGLRSGLRRRRRRMVLR